jgi:hypothetical protein
VVSGVLLLSILGFAAIGNAPGAAQTASPAPSASIETTGCQHAFTELTVAYDGWANAYSRYDAQAAKTNQATASAADAAGRANVLAQIASEVAAIDAIGPAYEPKLARAEQELEESDPPIVQPVKDLLLHLHGVDEDSRRWSASRRDSIAAWANGSEAPPAIDNDALASAKREQQIVDQRWTAIRFANRCAS